MKKEILFIFFASNSIACVQEPNVKQKLRNAKKLVREGAKYLLENDLFHACHIFAVNPTWRKGDLSITLIREDGTIFTNPYDRFSTWDNISKYEEEEVTSNLQRLESRAGYLDELFIYRWEGDLKYTSVEKVQKGNESFYVTAGFYPQSKEFQTKYLVKSGLHLIKDTTLKNALENYDKPHYKRGIISIEVYKEDGTCMANVERPHFVGKNMLNFETKDGIKFVKEAIDLVKKKKKGWIEYAWRNTKKRSYIHKYVDPETQETYVVMAGYFPDIDRNMLPKFVKKAATYAVVNGKDAAISAFNDLDSEFTHGPLQIILFDQEKNQLTKTYAGNTIKEEFFQRLLIEVDQRGIGWEFGEDRYTETGGYAEKITLNGTPFYIATVYYINSKKQTTELFVKQAIEFLRNQDYEVAMKEFCTFIGDLEFYRGDQYIFVYDMNGRCLAHGDNINLVQRDLTKITDQKGKFIVEELINIAKKQQHGWASFHLRNSIRHTYVERFDKKIGKEEKSFIVGSGFWG